MIGYKDPFLASQLPGGESNSNIATVARNSGLRAANGLPLYVSESGAVFEVREEAGPNPYARLEHVGGLAQPGGEGYLGSWPHYQPAPELTKRNRLAVKQAWG